MQRDESDNVNNKKRKKTTISSEVLKIHGRTNRQNEL